MIEPSRITDAAATPNAADVGTLVSIRTEYPTACPWNSTGEYLLLVTNSGYFRLCDGNGLYLCDLPFDINSSSEPRWVRTILALLYLVGNQIRSYNVDTRTSDSVRTFQEYISVSGKGESDIVGTSMVLLGESQEREEVFTFDLKTGAKGPELDVTGQGVESLYLSADGDVLVSSPAGMDLFDASMAFRYKITESNPHKCMARDTNGDAVLVWCCSDDGPMDRNGIVKTRLADGAFEMLYMLPWKLAMHFASCEQAGVVYVSTYHDPHSRLSKDSAPTEFDNAILRVPLDGSGITKLADTGSVGDSYECGQPRAAINRAGDRVAWGSNQGGATVDTFLLSLADENPRTKRPHKPGKKRRGVRITDFAELNRMLETERKGEITWQSSQIG